jgi:EmrB/QacA subfamily drug resistance transporter
MDLLDGTTINVASADIARDLHSTSTQLQWILSGYSLTFAVGLVAGARLGDIFGRRRLFLIGVAGYLVTAVGCATSQSNEMLIAFRLAQGLAAALLIPQGLGLIKSVFAPRELGKAISIFGPVIGLASVLGPVIGGLLVDADLFGTDWRPVFLIHVPFGLAAAYGAIRFFPQSRVRPAPVLDLVGALLLAVFAGLIIYPLIQGRAADWPLWTFLMLAGSGVVFAGFLAWTRLRMRQGRDPLVTPSVFEHRAFSGGIIMTLVLFSAMIGAIFTLTVFLRFGQRDSAIRAGLTLTPFAFGLSLGAVIASVFVVPRIGRTALQLGALLMAAGSLWTWQVVDSHGLETTAVQLIGAQLVVGIGIGVMLAPLINFVVSSARDAEVGSATGVFNSAQQLASAAGVAIIGTVFFSVLTHDGFVTAYSRCLVIEAGLAIVLFGLTYLLPKRAPEVLDA